MNSHRNVADAFVMCCDVKIEEEKYRRLLLIGMEEE